MALHYYDSSNQPYAKTDDGDHGVVIEGWNQLYLAAGAHITALGYSASGIFAGDQTKITVDGSVNSGEFIGLKIGGNSTVQIGSTGSIQGDVGGIYSYGGSNTIYNGGMISGAYGIWFNSGTNTVVNDGVLSATTFAVGGSGNINILNSGTIIGQGDDIMGDYAIALGSGNDVITNMGLIVGPNISLSTGDDTYDNRLGSFAGVVELGGGNDTAYGGAGDDSFVTSGGENFVDGGAGTDTYIADYLLGSLTIDLGMTDPQWITGSVWDTVINVENATGVDSAASFDLLIGSAVNNKLMGLAGNDALEGGFGNDTLDGGYGIDTARFYGEVGVSVSLMMTGPQNTGLGWDKLISIENLTGGDGNDYLVGDFGANVLVGEGGNDSLIGSNGDDTLDGGAGDDIVIYGGAKDSYTIKRGNDGTTTVSGKEGTDLLKSIKTVKFGSGGSVDLDTLGVTGVTTGTGTGSGTTTVTKDLAPSYTPVVTGNVGNIISSSGKKVLVATNASDSFIFSTKLAASAKAKAVVEYQSGQDVVQLDNAIFKKLGSGSATSPKMLSDKFFTYTKAKDKKDYLIYNERTGLLSYDADGSGTKYKAVEIAKFTNKAQLDHSDFFVI